jgi:23S rRNA (cytidine2498-2'-O)-methyltransferase
MRSEVTGYLAAAGFVPELEAELGDVDARYDRLLIARGPPRPAAWAANIWYDPQTLTITSIGDAAHQLRAIQRNWALYSHARHRRAALIAERLPKVSAKPLVFGTPPPSAPLGSWTLLDEGTVLAAPRCSSAFPHGEARFAEDRQAPPSRAYLKLWEALTLLGERPSPGQVCVDLGSSPGGWSWVLQALGARVVSIDKAPLDPRIGTLPGVDFRAMSAFALDPRSLGPVDWCFSDLVCYPARLLALLDIWLAAGTCRRFLWTVKFQGPTDFAAIRRLAALPGGRLVHLHHNKHELTWIKIA